MRGESGLNKLKTLSAALDIRGIILQVICSYPVHSDGFEVFEGEVPGRFGAVPPFRLHKLEQGISGHILRYCGDPGGHTLRCTHLSIKINHTLINKVFHK